MTKEQAIKLLRKETSVDEIHRLEVEEKLDFNEVIDIMNEAMDIAIEALEKQVPKKVIPYEKKLKDFLIQGYFEKGKTKKWNECPSCRKHVYKELFCRRCGQKLDWSGADE